MNPVCCALTGEPALDPVVCVKNGLTYERSSVKKLAQSLQHCPLTKLPLVYPEDFVAIRVAKAPKAFFASRKLELDRFEEDLLQKVQEGLQLKRDAAELQTRVAREAARQAAAIRVIRRLTGERDHLRSKVAHMGIVEEGLPVQAGRQLEPEKDQAADAKRRLEANCIRLHQVRRTLNALKETDPFVSKPLAPSQTQQLPPSLDGGWRILGSHPANHTQALLADQTQLLLAGPEGQTATQLALPRASQVCSHWSGEPDSVAVASLEKGNLFATRIDETGRARRVFDARRSDFVDFADIADSQFLACLADDGFVHVVDLDSEKSVFAFHTWTDGKKPDWLRVHPDGQLVFVGGDAVRVSVFDLLTGEHQLDLDSPSAHKDSLRQVCFSQNGFFFLLQTAAVVEVWDLRTCELLVSRAWDAPVLKASFTPKGASLLVLAGGRLELFAVEQTQLTPLKTVPLLALPTDFE